MAKAKLGIVLILVSCCFAVLASGQVTYPSDVDALRAIRKKLVDTKKHLRNWRKGDPCVYNWTGVICNQDRDDGYLYVQELRILNMNLSGTLAPELGQLSNLTILNFMWNQNITGTIPKEIGNIKSLKFLLLSGNQLSGSLPDELGNLSNLLMLQVDLNQISGTLPKSYVNLTSCNHFHMNNNSISGQIPSELYSMPQLLHFLVDNNNLSGHLPPEFSLMPNLKIFQLDNNNFGGTEIPASYSNMSKLVKISFKNCNLTGAIPDFSGIQSLKFIDLSENQLSGEIPTNRLSDKITTIDLSYNLLNGSIPSNFLGLPRLQRLSLENNSLSGDVPSDVWQNENFSSIATLTIDLRNNLLSNISNSLNPPVNVTIRLEGNAVCNSANLLNIVQFCGNTTGFDDFPPGSTNYSNSSCTPCHTDDYEEYVPDTPEPCFCAVPFEMALRLRSPTFTNFPPYRDPYRSFITYILSLNIYQLIVASVEWQEKKRLRLYLKFFPQYSNTTGRFNSSEIQRIISSIVTFVIHCNDTFGPYEVLNWTLVEPYANVFQLNSSSSGLSKGALVGIILGAISMAVTISLAILVFFYKRKAPKGHKESKKVSTTKVTIRTEGIKEFSFVELESATNGFEDNTEVGHGGYGKVFRGVLANGIVVAIKRAQHGSLQGQTEFITEIELLSRLHHRNLVSLVGYCCEEDELMLVYEFTPNGSLHDLLSDRYRHNLSFPLRMPIALGSAKGILYLHTEAYPPIIHRDIKANNILLDFKFNPKVSDFGISKIAPDAEGASAHVSTVVKGTPGYLDPEYFLTHKLTEKSDVYSLGVVFLELLTGMLPISRGRNIVREVTRAYHFGNMFSIVDRSMGSYSSECIKKFMALALRCCQDDPKQRPTMLEVVRELENLCSTLTQSDFDVISTESSDAANSNRLSSGSASFVPPTGRSFQMSTEILGSKLISGVVPTSRPR